MKSQLENKYPVYDWAVISLNGKAEHDNHHISPKPDGDVIEVLNSDANSKIAVKIPVSR